MARDPWRGIHNALRAAIISAEYPPGARLVEQQLADRFGTSRGPVRTALQELERSGLVHSVDRRGTFVRAVSDADIEEIFSLTEVLWRFAIRRAVANITDADRHRLEEIKARGHGIDEPDAFLDFAMDVGREVFRIASHRRALEIYDSLLVQWRARALDTSATIHLEAWRAQNHSVDPLCDALLRGDAPAAIAAADEWMGRSRTFWLDHLAAADEPDGEARADGVTGAHVTAPSLPG